MGFSRNSPFLYSYLATLTHAFRHMENTSQNHKSRPAPIYSAGADIAHISSQK